MSPDGLIEALSEAFIAGSDWQRHGNSSFEAARDSCVAAILAQLPQGDPADASHDADKA